MSLRTCQKKKKELLFTCSALIQLLQLAVNEQKRRCAKEGNPPDVPIYAKWKINITFPIVNLQTHTESEDEMWRQAGKIHLEFFFPRLWREHDPEESFQGSGRNIIVIMPLVNILHIHPPLLFSAWKCSHESSSLRLGEAVTSAAPLLSFPSSFTDARRI